MFDWFLGEMVKSVATGANILGKGVAIAAHIVNRNLNIDGSESVKLGILPRELLSVDWRGFIFGKNSGYIISKPETLDGHILIVGGPGSGKTSCIAIPTLLSWQQRVFAIDIKGELYRETRHKRANIKVFNPLDNDSYGYDPYYALKTARNPSQEARAIAIALIPTPIGAKDPFWHESEQNLLTAAILHFWYQGKSFIETMIAIKSTPLKILVAEIADSPQPEARLFINQFVGSDDDKVLFGVYSGVSNKITIFATDLDLKASLSKKKIIKPNDIENGFDIYISVPEHLLEPLAGFLTLIVSQRIRHDERRNEETAVPTLYLLDEFPRLGKMDNIAHALATLRSKKITVCLIVQSIAQLDDIYGYNRRKVITDNCSYKAILGAGDPDTREYFSRLVGTYEATRKTSGETYEAATFGLPKTTSSSETTAEKRIIKPEEFATLEDIVLITPYGFMRADKTPHYLY